MATPNIALLNAVYNDVSGVTLPKQGGGTATFPWVEGSQTVTQNGTVDVTSLAQLIVNVSGGSGGLEYETGTFSPTANIAAPTINFANTHSKCPSFVVLYDVTNAVVSNTYTNLQFAFYEVTGFSGGTGSKVSSTSMLYGYVWTTYFGSKTTSTSTTSKNLMTPSTSQSDDQNNMARYYVNESWFKADTASTSRYWRQGRTYKWIAVWSPTS